ncbi:MAG: citrate synthase [Halobacteriaceae archaeon]
MSETVQRGLRGVVVDESDLSYIDGDEGRLVYRGYSIEDIARDASYEEVLYLLWHGDLPTRAEREAFADEMAAERGVDDSVLDTLATLAEADERPMAALRTAVSMLSAADPEPDATPGDIAAALRKGRRITAKVPTILAAYDRLRNGQDPVAPREDLDHAENFLYMLDGTVPDPVAAETFDMALTLHADHGLNASTFTAMVVCSTLADMYNSVTAGIGALSGPRHGGANQDVMEMLLEIDESGDDPVDWVATALDERDDWRVPGWGHGVYNVKDPRAVILEEKSRDLGQQSGDTKWYEMASAIETYLTEEKGLPDHGIAPNVDFYSGTVYYQLGIPFDMYTPIFAMSRVGGWAAHVLEYNDDNRLIRPRAKYTGAKRRDWVPIEDRD